MQLSWLEDFVELARTRSFSRAAENRFVTHPAFGRRIRSLEEWVGTALIERKQPVSLTSAGTLFLDAAVHSLDVLNATRSQLKETSFRQEETLRIATGRTLATTFLPDWYESIHKRFGPFSVSVSTSGGQEAIMRLSAGDVDLLVSYSSPAIRLLIDPKHFESLTIEREVLVPVSAPDSKGKPKFRIPHAGGVPTPWLAYAPSLILRGVLAKHLSELPRKLSLRSVYQADSYESILEMAKRGVGLAWLPQRLIQDEWKQGRLMVVGDASMRVGFDICLYRLRNSTNPIANSIWKSLSADAGVSQ